MVSKDSSSRIDWKRWFWTNGPYAGSLNFVAKSPKAAAEEKVSKKTEKLYFFGFCSNLYDNEIGKLCRPIYFHMLFADSSKSKKSLNPLWKYTKRNTWKKSPNLALLDSALNYNYWTAVNYKFIEKFHQFLPSRVFIFIFVVLCLCLTVLWAGMQHQL